MFVLMQEDSVCAESAIALQQRIFAIARSFVRMVKIVSALGRDCNIGRSFQESQHHLTWPVLQVGPGSFAWPDLTSLARGCFQLILLTCVGDESSRRRCLFVDCDSKILVLICLSIGYLATEWFKYCSTT